MAFRSPNHTVQVEIERMETLSTDDIFHELTSLHVDLDARTFQHLCHEFHSITEIAKQWASIDKVAEPVSFAAAAVLWDRLSEGIFLWEQFAGMMSKGIEQIRQNLRRDALDSWLDAWALLQPYARERGIQDISILDAQAPASVLPEECFAWVQDLEMELTNQVDEDPGIASALLAYTTMYRNTFPKSATPILLNMRSAEGIALFVLGRAAEADVVYEELCDSYPEDAWTYIDWADQYSPAYHRHATLVDANRAIDIYRRGLRIVTEDRDILEERIREASET